MVGIGDGKDTHIGYVAVGDAEIAKANARLITAAPELLSSCEESLEWLEAALDSEPADFDNPKLEWAVKHCRAAIAKARGEA